MATKLEFQLNIVLHNILWISLPLRAKNLTTSRLLTPNQKCLAKRALSKPCDYCGVSVLSWKCQFSFLLLRISKILASENLDVYLGLNLQYLSSLVWQCVEKVRRNNTLIILESEEVDWAFLNLSTRFHCNTEISLHFFFVFYFIFGNHVKFSYTMQQISLLDFSCCILFNFIHIVKWRYVNFSSMPSKLIVWLKKVNT